MVQKSQQEQLGGGACIQSMLGRASSSRFQSCINVQVLNFRHLAANLKKHQHECENKNAQHAHFELHNKLETLLRKMYTNKKIKKISNEIKGM